MTLNIPETGQALFSEIRQFIAAATQQQFPEIIDASSATPQLIYERDRPVVAVIRADLFQEFLTWQQKQQPISLVEALEELHQICLEENYTFEITQHSGF